MNTQTYTVNIRTGVVNITRVDVSQGDTGRTLAFSLYDGLSPFTPPTGSTVTIVGRKPSKLGFSEACTVSGNVATVTTTLAMTQEAGKFPAELRIEANGESIGTANFTMYIEPSPHPDGTTDGTHATVDNLQTQIGNLANLATTAKTNLVSAINEAAQSGGVVIDDLEDLDERVEALEEGSGSSLTAEIKQALLACFEHVIFDDNVDDYYGNLYSALYETTWSITNILNECTSNNAATSVNKGASYTATLITNEFYEIASVSVIMGGVDVTNIVYNAGVINIPSVTGAVVINATATLSLPSGYTALNYILTTGAEYAESGVYESATPLSCEAKIRRTSYSTTTPNAHILSSNNSYYSYQGTTNNAKNIKTKFNGGTASENAFEWELDTDYIVTTDVDNLSVKVNDTIIGSFAIGETYNASSQFTIGTYGGTPTQTKYRFIGRIYYIKLYNTNGIAHFFRPAVRNNDNVVGFYDLATDTFITSATATAFTGA